MKRYRNRRFLAVAVCFLLILSAPMKGFAGIKTGGIKISLSCYEESESGERILFHRIPDLVPNEQISYIICVTNHESDAWIRLKAEVVADQSSDSDQEILGDHWLRGIQEDWVKSGEYWYYTKPLKRGASVDFCKGIRVPNLESLPNGMKFRVCSYAEAVQADNMIPDFSAEDPFSEINIDGQVRDETISLTEQGFRIQVEDGADLILDAESLFSDVDVLMPGDVFFDTVEIRNTNSYPVRVILRENGEAIDDRLSKVINLSVVRGKHVIYDGPLADHAIKHGLNLGRYESCSEEQLEFILSMDESAENNTAFHEIDVSMIFSVLTETKENGKPETMKPTESNGREDWTMYPYPDPAVEKGVRDGEWKLIDEEKHEWEYYFPDGSQAIDGWLYLYNPYSPDEEKNGWFYFKENGLMQFGWVKAANENWYFCHEISDGNLGRMKRGWHYDQDDRRTYYLDPVTGIMQTGWRVIEGKYYYFTTLEETYRQNWFWNTKIGRWIYDFLWYRTYGSMFENERTPDGYLVDEDGRMIGE